MGNCQAIEAAALVIQHPCGKIERLYWSISASEVMRLNPGHYVSLIIPLPSNDNQDLKNDNTNTNQPKVNTTVRFTRVKLLRPNDTLALGHAYRLVTTQGMYYNTIHLHTHIYTHYTVLYAYITKRVYMYIFRGNEGFESEEIR